MFQSASGSNGDGKSPPSAIWFDEPGPEDEPLGFDIFRTPTRKPFRAIVLSHRPVGSYTHYAGGRSRPCLGDGCSICEHGQRPRWHGWLAVCDRKTFRRALFEYPRGADESLREALRRYDSLRGHEIRASRRRPEANARVVLEVSATLVDLDTLPPEFDVRSALVRIWGTWRDSTERGQNRAAEKRAEDG